jgi:putative phage-type endonuclease
MLKQNTPEWEAWRKTKIGASDAPVIMGVSPHETPYQLWEEKLDLATKKKTWGMEQGHLMEEKARKELEKLTGFLFSPQVKDHPTIPWMGASLDCMEVSGKYIGEIKYANQEDYCLAASGKIPEKHFPQLQHQLEVCGLEMTFYFSFNGEQGALVKVYRDDAYIKKMIKKEEEFWEKIQNWTPPDLTDRDYVKNSDVEALNKAAKLKTIIQQIKELEEQEKALRPEILELAGRRNCIIGDLKITRSVAKGNVDYKSIPELKAIDLEKYRKGQTERFTITALR